MNRKRDLATFLLGITVAVIIWITIIDRDRSENIAYSLHLYTFSFLIQNLQRGIYGNVLGNIFLFIPYGFLLPIVWNKRLWRIIGAGLSLSFFNEITQLLTFRGMCDLNDTILNTTGVVIGYCIYMVIEKLHKMKETKRSISNNKYVCRSGE